MVKNILEAYFIMEMSIHACHKSLVRVCNLTNPIRIWWNSPFSHLLVFLFLFFYFYLCQVRPPPPSPVVIYSDGLTASSKCDLHLTKNVLPDTNGQHLFHRCILIMYWLLGIVFANLLGISSLSFCLYLTTSRFQ